MATRLWRFEFSTAVSYTVEVGAEYFRFFTDGGQVVTSAGPYEVAHPYLEADIADLYPKQINDVVYICHPDYPVGKLSRVTNTSWTYEVVVFDTAPMLDENITATTITASDQAGNGITLTATAAIFDALHVGSYWRLGYKRSVGSIDHFMTSSFDTWDDVMIGFINVRTYGTWYGDVVLQRETSVVGVWEDIARWISKGDRNVDAEIEVEELARYRLSFQNVENYTDGRAVLEWSDAIVYGTVKITAVGTDGMTATANVVETLYEERNTNIAYIATPYWQEGAWSDYRGYPRAVTCHEQRLVFGGTAYQPAFVWGSVVGDFENFLYGPNEDDAWAYQLAADELNAIQWLESLGVLAIGTTGGEWRAVGDEYGASITPTKRNFKQRSFHGSEHVAPVKVGDSTLLFVERKGRKIRELFIEGDAFTTADLTLLSEHVTSGDVVQIAWQRDQRILWMVNGDGELWGLTYDREQQVAGWHGPHTTDGTYQSVCTIYGEAGAHDEVWFVISRTLGSTAVLSVERFDPTRWTAVEDYIGVDAAVSYSGSPASSFAGATHLAGQTVAGLADGVPFTTTVDSMGAFSLPSGMDPAGTVHVGLPFTAEFAPFRLDVDANGVYAGRTRRIDGLWLRVLNTAGGLYKKPDDATARDIEYPSERLGAGTLKTGDVKVPYTSGHEYDPTIIIRQTEPLPMTVLAMIVSAEVGNQ